MKIHVVWLLGKLRQGKIFNNEKQFRYEKFLVLFFISFSKFQFLFKPQRNFTTFIENPNENPMKEQKQIKVGSFYLYHLELHGKNAELA